MISADLECLESDLNEAGAKLKKLKALENRGTFHEFIEDLIHDFEVSVFFFSLLLFSKFVKFIIYSN